MPGPQARFPDPDHDHDRCAREAMRRAEEHCRRHQLRLTAQRRQVLEIVSASHVPIGAYDILDAMAGGRRIAPMTVYRALDFLQSIGLVHRLASLNAYIACSRPDGGHGTQFFICNACAKVAEISDPRLLEALQDCGANCGFEVDQPIVELKGLCRHCRDGGRASP